MRVQYRSGTTLGGWGTTGEYRMRRAGLREYFVTWDNGDTGWYLATNLQF